VQARVQDLDIEPHRLNAGSRAGDLGHDSVAALFELVGERQRHARALIDQDQPRCRRRRWRPRPGWPRSAPASSRPAWPAPARPGVRSRPRKPTQNGGEGQRGDRRQDVGVGHESQRPPPRAGVDFFSLGRARLLGAPSRRRRPRRRTRRRLPACCHLPRLASREPWSRPAVARRAASASLVGPADQRHFRRPASPRRAPRSHSPFLPEDRW